MGASVHVTVLLQAASGAPCGPTLGQSQVPPPALMPPSASRRARGLVLLLQGTHALLQSAASRTWLCTQRPKSKARTLALLQGKEQLCAFMHSARPQTSVSDGARKHLPLAHKQSYTRTYVRTHAHAHTLSQPASRTRLSVAAGPPTIKFYSQQSRSVWAVHVRGLRKAAYSHVARAVLRSPRHSPCPQSTARHMLHSRQGELCDGGG